MARNNESELGPNLAMATSYDLLILDNVLSAVDYEN